LQRTACDPRAASHLELGAIVVVSPIRRAEARLRPTTRPSVYRTLRLPLGRQWLLTGLGMDSIPCSRRTRPLVSELGSKSDMTECSRHVCSTPQ